MTHRKAVLDAIEVALQSPSPTRQEVAKEFAVRRRDPSRKIANVKPSFTIPPHIAARWEENTRRARERGPRDAMADPSAARGCLCHHTLFRGDSFYFDQGTPNHTVRVPQLIHAIGNTTAMRLRWRLSQFVEAAFKEAAPPQELQERTFSGPAVASITLRAVDAFLAHLRVLRDARASREARYLKHLDTFACWYEVEKRSALAYFEHGVIGLPSADDRSPATGPLRDDTESLEGITTGPGE